MERILRLLLLIIVMMFSFINNAIAGYTGPTLKLPMQLGNSILCTVEAGGQIAQILLGPDDDPIDHWHTDAGYYSIDFDNRSSDDFAIAAAAGTISAMVTAGCTNQGTACYVQLDHGGGYKTLYYHLAADSIPSSFYIGKTVTQGETLGTIGNTGDSYGAHLHFSIKYNGSGYSYTDGLSGVEMEGIQFEDFVAGSYYDSSNDGVPDEPVCTVTNTSSAIHLMSVEPQSNSTYTINGFQVTGSGNSTALSTYGWQYTNTGNTATVVDWLVGDVDEDTWDDVVQIRIKNSKTYAQVYLSNGNGGLDTQSRWKRTSGTASEAFLADMNNDGKADLILGFANTDTTMTWKYYTSTGSGFNGATTWNTSFGTSSDIFVVGDFNGNGKAELLRGRETDGATGSNFTSALIWKRLDTSNNETTVLSSFGYSGDQFLAADLTNGGQDDLIRIDQADNTVTVYVAEYSTSTQQFITPISYATDVGGTDGTYTTYPLDDTDSYRDLIRFNGDDLLLLQSSGGVSFEEQSAQSTLVSGINASAQFLFGDFGEHVTTEESCTIPTVVNGAEVDPVDDESPDEDFDVDGYTTEDGDCNDLSNGVHPDHQEISDGVDNDCDGTIDEDPEDQYLFLDVN